MQSQILEKHIIVSGKNQKLLQDSHTSPHMLYSNITKAIEVTQRDLLEASDRQRLARVLQMKAQQMERKIQKKFTDKEIHDQKIQQFKAMKIHIEKKKLDIQSPPKPPSKLLQSLSNKEVYKTETSLLKEQLRAKQEEREQEIDERHQKNRQAALQLQESVKAQKALLRQQKMESVASDREKRLLALQSMKQANNEINSDAEKKYVQSSRKLNRMRGVY